MMNNKPIKILFPLIFLTYVIFFSSTFFLDFLFTEKVALAKTKESTPIGLNHSPKETFIDFKVVADVKEHYQHIEKPYIYLTFDDGPNQHTEKILEVLERYNAKSTFFVMHGNSLNYPSIIKKMNQGGHSIGCHGVTHRLNDFYGSVDSPTEEMNVCSEAIEDLIGERTELIRVPFGSFPHLTLAQKNHLEKAEFILWDWNVDSGDWNSQNHTPSHIVNNVMEQIKPLKERGTVPVILMHDKAITADALPLLIKKLTKLGYEFKAITPAHEPLQFKLKEEK